MPRTFPLFQEPPTTPNQVALAIPGSKPNLSPLQRQFNKIIGEISALKLRLSAWRDFPPHYQNRINSELAPLQALQRQTRIAMLGVFDQALTGKTLTKRERSIARKMLEGLLFGLIEEQPDPELDEIAKRHGLQMGTAPDEMELLHALGAEIFGVDLGQNHGAQTHDELAQKFAEELAARRAEQDARRKPRKKSAKEIERETRTEQAAREASQSVREIYRKLVRDLHPDRIADATDRAAKTELMQEANRAYEAGDLLALLELQWQIEQIDPTHLAGLADDRLRHFIHVLKERASTLQREINGFALPFTHLFPHAPPRDFAPSHVERTLDKELLNTRDTLSAMQEDLARYADPAELKRDIKAGLFDPQDPFDPDEFEDLAAMEEFLTYMARHPTAPRRAKRRSR